MMEMPGVVDAGESITEIFIVATRDAPDGLETLTPTP
jgi:hypothetical protein